MWEKYFVFQPVIYGRWRGWIVINDGGWMVLGIVKKFWSTKAHKKPRFKALSDGHPSAEVRWDWLLSVLLYQSELPWVFRLAEFEPVRVSWGVKYNLDILSLASFVRHNQYVFS